MKPINQFLSELLELSINLWVDGDRLRYQAPEGALTPELRAEIAARKAEIITYLKQPDFNSQDASQAIVPIPRDQDLPLSFGQQRLWFIHQLDQNITVYNESLSLKIEGRLQIPILEQVIQAIWQRHELLRTTFSVVEGSPVQIIHPPQNLPLPIIDLQSLPKQEQWSRVEQLVHQQDQQPFNLESDRLLRLTLIKLAENSHILSLTIHHIIADGSFMSIFIQEFTTLYEAFSEGKPSPLPQLSIQYADYAYWQHQTLQGELLEQHINYWKQQLADAPPYLELPTDHLRPPIQTFQGRGEPFQISASITQNLKQLSQQSGVTLFMTLIAAFTVLLSRHTNQQDIVIGSPIANRNSTQLERLLGFFVNNLILRTQLQPELSFTELLRQVRQVSLDAFEHSEAPFEKIVDELQIERNLSYHPLFQVAFVLQNTPMWKLFQNSPDGKLAIADLTLELLNFEQFKAKFDLTLEIVELDQKLTGIFIYNTDLFEAETIQRMIKHFQILLESIISEPQQIISQLPLMPEEELQQILVEWNATQTNYPQNYCIHQLFEQQVESTPQAISISFDNEKLTYSELNHRANQLAHYLQDMGVQPEMLVGICVERSLEMVIGLLGILKAGGAYVPFDPDYPSDRLAFMLSDSQISVLLTQHKLLAKIPNSSATMLCLDTDWLNIADKSDRNPVGLVNSHNLAYVIYTSGSTGKPKGAMNAHRGVVNRLLWMQETYQLTETDRVLQKTPFSFDVSVWEFFWTLITGARLVIAKPEGHKDSAYLLQLINQEEITTLHFVPSMLQVFLEEQGLSQCTSLKRVICSGEALPMELQRRFFARLGCELHNLYGPTEAAIDVTYWKCQSDSNLNTVPIGKPVANTQLYILNSQAQPVPIGVAGELHIGGIQVGRGYLNRPELTAEKFIPDRFSQDPEARLYKTGDRVRHLPDGSIDYLGRIDFQVKLRGFRIELGEIEAVLTQYPAIREAVVLLYEEKHEAKDEEKLRESGDRKYLVAYIVADQADQITSDQTGVDIAELRHNLKQQLPEYMVPAIFVLMDALPLSPNGKVDRRALPDPTPWRSALTGHAATARTPIEDILVNIWNNLLGISNVGIYDNFFELGGHSLMVVQVMARVRESFAVDLPMQVLFREPTISGLAQELETTLHSGISRISQPILPCQHSEQMQVSFAQQRMWFLQKFVPDSAIYNIPLAYRISGLLSIAALEQSLIELVKRHEILRTTFVEIDGQPTSVVSSTLPLSFTVVKIDADLLSQGYLQQQIDAEVRQPFDLSASSLFRVKLIQLAPDDHALVITFHHIIIDGWSIQIFMEELAKLYQSFVGNEPIVLNDLPISYLDFAAWQRQWLQGDVLTSQMSYWQTQLAKPITILRLPTDHPRPLIQTFRGTIQSLSLSESLTGQIKQIAKVTGTTLFMVLLSAFQIMLSRYSGELDIIVGTPIAGRQYVETEKLIGLFVNSLAIRTDMSGNPTVRQLLARVREITLAAYTHQDLPLEQVIDALQLKRDLSYSPLFQVMFSLLNMPSQSPIFSGFSELTLTPIETHTGTSRVDLTLELQETDHGIQGLWEYNCDLFDAETIHRMTGHFQTLLEGMVADLDQRIFDLPILTEVERNQFLGTWQQTATAYPHDRTIHQLFEEQVAKTPKAIAVVYEDQQISYQELNLRANQLARHLQTLGVREEELVGICVERSLEMLVGLLGILKAGAAYVPIDTSYPPERIAYMLEDAQIQVLVTQQGLGSKFENSLVQIVCLDIGWTEIAVQGQENLPSLVTFRNLACVIYTSGSTGEPKGVALEHRGVNRLVINTNYMQLDNSDRVAQASNISFDAATLEIWGAMLNGCTLIILSKDIVLSPQKLALQISQHQINTLFLTTALLNQIAKQSPAIFKSIKNLMFGGEASDPSAIRELLKADSPERIVHLYGPAENTTLSSWYLVKDIDPEATTIPIGQVIANSQIYILDQYHQPVPIGVTGEIYVGGDGLARGYINRPELTAEKFIRHPFSQDPTERLYKTGDLGRYLRDGNIEFVGRSDFQVKIRGFRIEIGEIETILGQHPEVQEILVIALDDARGSKQLVTYVVPKIETTNTAELTGRTLKKFLKEKLPDYMIPAFFVFLDELPLTPNGKVDRRALPTPDLASPSLESSFVAPSTPTEQAITKVWQEILTIEQIGIHDNFFELGGHSLIATQVMSRLPQIFSLDLPLSLLFELPTIAELGDRIDTLLWASGDALRASFDGSNVDANDEYTEGLL
jgi:amino acid adenylation domain-containing protein